MAPYSSANSCMDDFSIRHEDSKTHVTSIQWGALDIDNQGMATKEVLELMSSRGWGIVSVPMIENTLDLAVSRKTPSVLLVSPLSESIASNYRIAQFYICKYFSSIIAH